MCVLQSFASYSKRLILTEDGESWKATWQDVVVRILCADLSRGAQEEAPGRAGRLFRVLKEMLWEVEGLYGQFLSTLSATSCISMICKVNIAADIL